MNIKQKNQKKYILPLVIFLVLIPVLYFSNSDDKEANTSTNQQNPQSSNNSSLDTDTSADEDTTTPSAQKPLDNTKKTNTSTSQKLITPTGNFVSSHTAETDSLIASTCVTTSGATCTILFTKGSTTKQLQTEKTDLEGLVYWEWTPESLGLTKGVWKITASAKLGDQSKQTADAENLEIQ